MAGRTNTDDADIGENLSYHLDAATPPVFLGGNLTREQPHSNISNPDAFAIYVFERMVAFLHGMSQKDSVFIGPKVIRGQQPCLQPSNIRLV